jgi:glycosyltransferase involved in cell wall biosynthesis
VNRPSIGVVVPAFNAERFLGAALGSILSQSRPPDRVVVVDDGSTDGTAEEAARFGDAVRLLRQGNRGQSAARNRGAEEAGCDLLAFLDADDLWTPDKLDGQERMLTGDPSLDMAFGQVVQFREGGGQDPPAPAYFAGAMLVRRAAFDRVGPFDESLRTGEFLDWFLRAREAGLSFGTLPSVVLRRRIHGENLGVRMRDDRSDFVRLLKASLDRRRKV